MEKLIDCSGKKNTYLCEKTMDIRQQFKETEKLYHFTDFEKAKLILESKCLRFGRLNNMNDIHENDKLMYADANNQPIEDFPTDLLDTFYDEIYKYRQISLTLDNEDGDKKGFDLHQMWGLYADKGNGVCLVFDKTILTKYLDAQIILHRRVDYKETRKLESFCITNSANPKELSNEVKGRVSEIFFHKRKEWEHEQEYRILKRCPNPNKEEYLLLGKSLKFVIISSKLRNVDEVRYFNNMEELKKRLGNIPLLVYGNGLFDYALVTANQENIIWDSEQGYDILIPGVNCELAL